MSSGYRSQVKFPFTDQQTLSEYHLVGRDANIPANTVDTAVRLASPQLFRMAILKGMSFELCEGPKVIGNGKVTKIINEELNKKLTIKYNMETSFPILFKFANEITIDWETVYDTFMDKFNYHRAIWAKRNGASYRIEASFYNIITEARKQDEGAIRVLESIRMLFGSLRGRLDPAEKKLLTASVFGFLTSMDSKYLNYIGELHFVNYIKITKPESVLMASEELIADQEPDGPTFDFTFFNRIQGNYLKAEIVNLHFEEHQLWDEGKIRQHLEQKIGQKLASKRMKERPDLVLVPILWGQPRCLAPVAAYYREHSPTFPNTFTPFCYLPYGHSGETLDHIFGTIDSMVF